MPQPIRLAFLGVDHPHGAAWRELIGQFTGELAVAAIVPGFGGATTSLEERLADVPRFETVDALIARGAFDAAVVCLPDRETPDAVATLARAKKHVLVEKPSARTAAEWQPAVDAVRDAGVAFQNGYVFRYDRAAERLKAMVREGRFGRLISVEMTFVTSDVRRRGADHYLFDRASSGGGFFHWLACHSFDLLAYVTDEPVVGVTARTGVYGGVPTDVEDGGAVILELAGGGIATLVGGYWIPRWAGENRWTIRGTERWVEWNPSDGGGRLDIHGPQPHWHAMEETFRIPADTARGYGGGKGFALVRDWLDAIASRRPCRNTPDTTRAVLEILDALYRSSAESRRIACHIRAGSNETEPRWHGVCPTTTDTGRQSSHDDSELGQRR
ncbi:MAG: Gfo/Idh/MocA family oxidoreductase [Planctomycetes bacterium]|nr:Gfo/Idh/MocA family oxidoreductase [Planctomycetota bacterium]